MGTWSGDSVQLRGTWPLAMNVLDVAQEMHLPRCPNVALSANKVDKSNTYIHQPIEDYSYLTAHEKVGTSLGLFSKMDFHVTLVQPRSCGLVLTQMSRWTLMYRLYRLARFFCRQKKK